VKVRSVDIDAGYRGVTVAGDWVSDLSHTGEHLLRIGTRLSMSFAAAALAAGALQVTAPTPAQAVPVTCTGTAKVFWSLPSGALWYYEHRAPATGDYNWAAGRQIGAGFTGRTVASTDGAVYLVNAAGELRRYRYDGSRWTDGAGTVVGTGWQGLLTDGRYQLTADARGRLFAIDNYGVLMMFDETMSRWDFGKGIPLDLGWFGDRVVGGGDGILYRIGETSGELSRYRYDADSARLTRATAGAGNWTGLDPVLSPGGDVLYAAANGTLYWYRYDADTGTWANNGNGRVVGNGWHGSNGSVTAAPGTCTVPAPAPVAPATPAAATTGSPLQLSGPAQYFGYAYRDTQGRAVELRETSDTTVSRTPVGTKTFVSDLSAATAQDQGITESLVGLDSSGTAWLSEGNWQFSADWQPFGKGMTRVALTESFSPSYLPQAVGVDGSGTLWWRRQVSTPNGRGWLPWQQAAAGVTDFQSVASTGTGVYGVAGNRWFDVNRDSANGNRIRYRDGALPQAADVTQVTAAEVTYTSSVLVARLRSSGQAVFMRGSATGFDTAWQALPPLTADGAVTVADVPMSATELSTGAVAVAAVGSDSHVYVTNGRVSTGVFAPWQQVGAPIAGAPQLLTPNFQDVQLGYRGQDGKVYHYGALTPNNTNPLDFNGAGRTEP